MPVMCIRNIRRTYLDRHDGDLVPQRLFDGSRLSRKETALLRSILLTDPYDDIDRERLASELINCVLLGHIRRDELPDLINAAAALQVDIQAEELLSGAINGEFIGYPKMLLNIIRRLGDGGREIAKMALNYRIDPRDLERIESLCLGNNPDYKLIEKIGMILP